MALDCTPHVPDRRQEPGQAVLPRNKGQEQMTLSCSRGGLDWTPGQNFSRHGLLRAVVVESLSLEMCRRHMDVVFGDPCGSARLSAGLDDL